MAGSCLGAGRAARGAAARWPKACRSWSDRGRGRRQADPEAGRADRRHHLPERPARWTSSSSSPAPPAAAHIRRQSGRPHFGPDGFAGRISYLRRTSRLRAGGLPGADIVLSTMDLAPANPGPDTWAVVATIGPLRRGRARGCAGLSGGRVGLIASTRRSAAVRHALNERGLDEATVSRLRSPAGKTRASARRRSPCWRWRRSSPRVRSAGVPPCMSSRPSSSPPTRSAA